MTIRELLQDSTWQAIGVIVTTAAILVSIAIYRLQKQKRALTYYVKSSYTLLQNRDELDTRLVVQVDGVVVDNVRVMFLEVTNSGNHSIARGDFDIPFSVTFHETARVLSAVVFSEEPQNLGADLIVDERTVRLSPLLMNAGD